MKNVLVFGSSGALGAAISDEFENLDFNVIRLTSGPKKENYFSTQDVNWANTVCSNGKTVKIKKRNTVSNIRRNIK